MDKKIRILREILDKRIKFYGFLLGFKTTPKDINSII